MTYFLLSLMRTERLFLQASKPFPRWLVDITFSTITARSSRSACWTSVLEGQRERFMTSYATSAITPMAEVKIRPAVQVFCYGRDCQRFNGGRHREGEGRCEGSGRLPWCGHRVCYSPLWRRPRQRGKADEAEKAVKAEEAAKVAAKAAAEAG